MLLNVLCIILCYSVLPSRCYAAWFPTSNYTAWPSLTDVMLLNVVTSDRVTLFGLVFMMLHCLVFSISCLATQRMNFISKGFSTQNYSGSTSFSCLASAASLVAIFWFQLEKSAGEVRRPKLQILWRMVKRQQLTFIKQKPTHFHIFLPPCQSVHKRSWNEETGTPSNLSLSSKRRAAPGKSCIYSIRQINAKRP